MSLLVANKFNSDINNNIKLLIIVTIIILMRRDSNLALFSLAVTKSNRTKK